MPHITSPLSQNICTLSYHKPLLGTWLIQQIDSRGYPGLFWLDANHTKFRISWKHNSRKDISEDDYKLFKAWARVSGKYSESQRDPAKWKSNFRCALNSISTFKMMENNSRSSTDPHKVYEILSCPQPASQNNMPNGTSPVEERPLIANDSCVPRERCIPVVPPFVVSGIYDIGKMSLDDTVGGEGTAFGEQLNLPSNCASDVMLWQDGWTIPIHSQNDPAVLPCTPEVLQYGTQWDGVQCVERNQMQNMCSPIMSSCGAVYQQNNPDMNGYRPDPSPGGEPWKATTDEALPCAQEQHTQHVITQPAYNTPTGQPYHSGILPPVQNLEVTINYRKKEMLHSEFTNCNIYQLCYKENTTFGQPIHFPSPENLPDEKQVLTTKELLQSIKNGLLLEIKQKSIYAKRLGKCKVFWLVGNLPAEAMQNSDFNLLPRDEEREIFSFAKFYNDWKNYKENKGGSPEYTIYLCFGQRINDNEPKEKKLILVKIIPKICSVLHEMAQREGASSLNNESISLQISGMGSLYDDIDSYMRFMDIDMLAAPAL